MLKLPSIPTFFRENLKVIFVVMLAACVMSWFIWRGCCDKISNLFWISAFTTCIWLAL